MNNETNHSKRAGEPADDRFLAWLLQAIENVPAADGNSQTRHSLAIGAEPTVQNRFQALLKRRIQQELHDNLPLFPWEAEVMEYANDPLDEVIEQRVPEGLWLTQLQQRLRVPIEIPSEQLAQLFARCQQLAGTSLRQGERLVAAVEALFPDRTDELNLWTERMLMWSASRSQEPLVEPSEGNFPETYDAATPTQQLLLSLLAAKEIVETLSLQVSTTQPRDRRQWFADTGILELEAEYYTEGETAQLRVCCQLPDGGRVQLQGDTTIATAQRRDPGQLAVELSEVRLNQIYTLEVHLDASSQSPLVFSICPTL